MTRWRERTRTESPWEPVILGAVSSLFHFLTITTVLPSPVSRQRNVGTERLSSWPEVTQLAREGSQHRGWLAAQPVDSTLPSTHTACPAATPSACQAAWLAPAPARPVSPEKFSAKLEQKGKRGILDQMVLIICVCYFSKHLTSRWALLTTMCRAPGRRPPLPGGENGLARAR